MENSDFNSTSNGSVVINDEIKGFLLETCKWGKFLSILGYVTSGIMLIAGIGILIVGSVFGGYMTSMVSFLYIILAILYFFPVNYLFKSSQKIKQGIFSNNQDILASGFENMKKLYKFIGIMSIVTISIYILAIIGFVVFKVATMF